ncbi:hypothetical protein [Deinococcus sp. 23YEL01]|uniref:hypothetical protein n=1 Tax=Deinococcus sp. 23YEL01 TaxID=2745871 RepID=UPI001E46A182|nr:hypothetical protein [Deinococcus sp. 23YEL01]MCD0168082.1 hypothetical protein [Deinococcus sp. 23YEL01]
MATSTEIQQATALLKPRFDEGWAPLDKKGVVQIADAAVRPSDLVDDELKQAAFDELKQLVAVRSGKADPAKHEVVGMGGALAVLAPLILQGKLDDLINSLLDLIFSGQDKQLKESVCGEDYSAEKAKTEGFWINAASQSLTALGLFGVALAPIPAVIAAVALVLAKYGHERICNVPAPATQDPPTQDAETR